MASNNPFYVAPASPLQALMLGVEGYDRSQKLAKEAETREALQDIGKQVQAGGLDNSALGRLFSLGNPQLLTAAAALNKANAEGQGVFGTPIYGTRSDGTTAIGTFDKKGTFREIPTPGFTPTPGIRTIDTGTGTVIVGSRSGMPIGGQATQVPGGAPSPSQPQPQGAPGYYPKDVEGEARGKRYGTEVGERQADLGRAKASLDTSFSSLDRLADFATRVRKSPGLAGITGVQGMFPNWPGGQAANAQANLETLKSQVSFGVLQAMREASKTGGALGSVSDAEGKRLENNLAALDRAQSFEQFQKAMDDIVEYTRGAKARLQAAYDQDYASIPPPSRTQQQPQQRPAASKTINGKTYFQVNGQWFEQ